MPAKKAAKKSAKKTAKTTAKKSAKAAPSQTEVKLGAVKGRPMLQWVGKRPLNRVTAFPAQTIESFNPTHEDTAASGQLFHGDNKEVLAHLLANGYRGKVNLIYIDPPFDSGADYVRKVELRGKSAVAKLEGETYTLGEQVQYTDIWANDNYLQFVYERLILMKELLDEFGFIVVHADHNKAYLIRMLLDEVFGSEKFVNEVIWQHAVIGAGRGIYTRLPKAHESLIFYSKCSDYTFNSDAEDARVPYKDRITKNLTKDDKGYYYTRGRTGTDNPWSKDPRYLRTYVDIEKGKLVHDVWDDILTYRAQGDEYVGYPTQKPEQLIRRVVSLLSDPGDLILDCFNGSGTTAAVAQKLGRRWIGCDINKGAIQTTSKRLQAIIHDQLAEREKQAAKGADLIPDENAPVPPAAHSFQVHRVNDYDLQIQHNEAVALACEHIGVERRKDDTYFDGLQGKRLVKVVPFNHPLSPADLEQLKSELKTRPEEERDILLICLGKERHADDWLTEWNRLRKRGDVPNKIEVIELRTDAKYGKFIEHKPASAKVSVKCKGKELILTIEDFISPTILERLEAHNTSLMTAKIKDWRAMVDCVLIDPDYDGKVFQIAISDLPAKKTDLVSGTYTLPAPTKKGTTVAIKIIDMLGEEVLITQRA